MAEKVVDRLYDRLHKEEDMPIVETKTTHIDLDNGAFKNAKAVKKYRKTIREQLEAIGLEQYYAGYLVSNYGKATDEIIEGMAAFDSKALHLKLIRSELRYCLENEMVFSIQDFYIRRTGRLYFDIHSIKPTLEVILKDFQNHFGWSEEKTLSEKKAMEKAIEEVSVFG